MHSNWILLVLWHQQGQFALFLSMSLFIPLSLFLPITLSYLHLALNASNPWFWFSGPLKSFTAPADIMGQSDVLANMNLLGLAENLVSSPGKKNSLGTDPLGVRSRQLFWQNRRQNSHLVITLINTFFPLMHLIKLLRFNLSQHFNFAWALSPSFYTLIRQYINI